MEYSPEKPPWLDNKSSSAFYPEIDGKSGRWKNRPGLAGNSR
jgi:hypothetical protein